MYSFDKISNRKNTNSLKWDYKDCKYPMWVADMDFDCAPCILDAIKKRVECPVFGYSITPDSYFDAYISWWDRRHHIRFERDWMLYSLGVVPSISSMVRSLTRPAEKVIIQSPVYNIFYNSIYNNGRYIVSSDLIYDHGFYHIDLEDLEEKMQDPQATLMILCNPHNPIGHIWSKEDLYHIGMLAKKYNVTIISDEIHCDICEVGYEYTPFLSVDESFKDISITCIAATKCFGIPGLHSSALVIPNPRLRHIVNRGLNNDEVAEGNVFSYDPIIRAFTDGEKWVDEMNLYVTENKKAFKDILKDTKLIFASGHATYLLWVDVSSYTKDAHLLEEFLLKEYGIYFTSGKEYGQNGSSFLRINLATSKANVLEAAKLFKEALERF